MRYRVTKTFWKDVEVDADSYQEAVEKANLNHLFDSAELQPADDDEAELIIED